MQDDIENDNGTDIPYVPPPPEEQPSAPPGSTGEYPGSDHDRQGPGGEQEAANRAVREQQARDLNAKLGIDGGNLESFLSGRNTWEGYLADQNARARNDTSYRPYDSQDPNPAHQAANRAADLAHRAGSGGGGGAGGGGGVQALRDRLAEYRATGDAAGMDSIERELGDLLTKQGHDVQWKGTQIIVDGRPYVLGGDDPSQEWMPSGQSSYTPGAITTDDIPNFSFDSLMNLMATPEVDAFVNSLLANPESMDPRTVEMLKAKTKDELAEMDIENQQALDTLGTSYGIQESPWLGAQKMDARRSRDNALVQSNRAIDMEAAETNMADRRAAAGIGLQAGAQKQSKVLAAASTALSRSAAIGDRLALREATNQEAAKLKISAEQLLASHIESRLSQMTEEYDIDVRSADARYDVKTNVMSRLAISGNELAQADRHFLEEMALKIEELDKLEAERKRADDRFKATHALDVRRQQWLEDHADDVEDD